MKRVRALLAFVALVGVSALATPAAAQEATRLETRTLAATDQTTTEYQLVAGGDYGLGLRGTLTDSAGAQFDALYCRNDPCGGAGMYVDNILGMGFTDANRQEIPDTFGAINKYVLPLPLFFSNNSSGYAVRFTAPRSGRLLLKTNWGNSTSRPVREGTLSIDLYKYSEPGGVAPPATGAIDPCGLLADVAFIAASVPCATGRGSTTPAPAPGQAKRILLRIPANTVRGQVDVALQNGGRFALGAVLRRQRIAEQFDTYARWCMITMLVDPQKSAVDNSDIFRDVFGFKVIRPDTSGGEFTAICKYAALVATFRQFVAEERLAERQPRPGPPTARQCASGAIAGTLRTRPNQTAVSRTQMPRFPLAVRCQGLANGSLSLRLTARPGRTLRQEFGGAVLPVVVARASNAPAGGQLAVLWRVGT